MIPLVFAAVVAAEGLQPSTLAGVTLGNSVANVLSQHPAAQKAADSSARWWTWSDDGGGTVIVTADDNGKVNRVDFVSAKGATNSIDLPCAGIIPVQDSQAHLERALKPTACSAYNGAAYGVPGGSVVEVRFSDFNAGSLVEATWYRPSVNDPTPVGQLPEVVAYLMPVLASTGRAARINYGGECPAKDDGTHDMLSPTVFLQPAGTATGMDAVSNIFRDDPNVAFEHDRFGLLRITIGSVSTALLQTKIRSVALSTRERYNADSALEAIMATPEADAAGRSLNVFRWKGRLRMIVVISPGEPPKDAPHLPSELQNVTLDEAFEVVAKTFQGIVSYGACKTSDGRTLFQINFIVGMREP
jgi:hypothetical protein